MTTSQNSPLKDTTGATKMSFLKLKDAEVNEKLPQNTPGTPPQEDASNQWIPDMRYPFAPHLNIEWEIINQHILRRCQRKLATFPSIDSIEGHQSALIQIRRRRFIKNYDPQKGNLWAYINRTVDFVCLGLIRDWKRHMQRCSPIELAGLITHSHSPVEEAMYRELLDDIRQIEHKLSPKELEALPHVLERASGSRCVNKSQVSSDYASESRCRAKLRKLIQCRNPSN